MKISRRNFILVALSGVGALTLTLGKLLANLQEQPSQVPSSDDERKPTSTPEATVVVEDSTVGRPRVVHVRNPGATFWDFTTGWYGDYVDQEAVDEMIGDGLRVLTGQESLLAAWEVLFHRVNESGYQPGEKIAIKVNLNNVRDCSENTNAIDALHHPINGLLRTLREVGVPDEDIWLYDATGSGRLFPDWIRTPIIRQHPNIVFLGRGQCDGVQPVSYSTRDATLKIVFNDPDGNLSDRWLPDLLGEASYLINIPILKHHGIHPVSLGFKNHFGSLNNIMRGGADNLHEYINPKGPYYRPEYSPFVDINKNVHIRRKTILVIGDAIYGSRNGATQTPVPWKTFNKKAPNSLIMGIDPVAVDCVMLDLVNAEKNMGMNGAYDYLYCAQDAGLGTCEGVRDSPGGKPWNRNPMDGYTEIDFIRLEK
jgi:hypothetical protein